MMASPDSEPGTGRESGNGYSCHQMHWPFFRHVGRGATYPIPCRESRLSQVQQGTTGLKDTRSKKLSLFQEGALMPGLNDTT